MNKVKAFVLANLFLATWVSLIYLFNIYRYHKYAIPIVLYVLFVGSGTMVIHECTKK